MKFWTYCLGKEWEPGDLSEYEVPDGMSAESVALALATDLELDAGDGIHLRAPDGTRHSFVVGVDRKWSVRAVSP